METEYEVCHYCFGKGSLSEEGYAECPYCGGTGFEEVYDYEDELDDEYLDYVHDRSDRYEGWWQ
jgi:RecJ-like exonuclease